MSLDWLNSLGFVFGLFYDMMFSWTRMIIALAISILFSWLVGILAARNKSAEKVIIPSLDILQSIPILGFFPLVLIVFVTLIPGSEGVNLAVIFLIFTSMSWNIAFSVYEAVKAIPAEFMRLVEIEKMSFFRKLTILYIPSTWSKIAYNSIISWAVALFYLVSSEIFTLGNSTSHVNHGIGIDISNYAASGDWFGYVAAVATLIVVDLLTWGLLLNQFANWSEKFKLGYSSSDVRRNRIYKFYSRCGRTISKRGSGFTKEGGRGQRTLADLRQSVQILLTDAKLKTDQTKKQETSSPFEPQRNHPRQQRRRVLALSAFAPFALIAWLKIMPIAVSAFTLPNFALISREEIQVLIALGYSLIRVWISYGIAVAIALPLGIVVALNKRIYSVLSPALQMVASVPAPVLLPPIALAMVLVPQGGEINAFIVIVIGMIWYILFNVVEGVKSAPVEIFETSKLLKMKGMTAWKNVFIPSALPSFVTGSITAIGGAWNALIVAEYFSIRSSGGNQTVVTQVPDGIGKLLDLATNSGNITLLVLGVLSMTVLIVGFNVTLWKRLYKHTTKRYACGPTR